MAYVMNLEMLIEARDINEIEEFVKSINEYNMVKEISVKSVNTIPEKLNVPSLNLSKNLVIFSKSEWMSDDYGQGFWSNDYGWCPMDLATRFTLEEVGLYSKKLPATSKADACWMADPLVDSIQPFAIKICNIGESNWRDFFCFAENVDKAEEVAKRENPNCEVYAFERMYQDSLIAKREAYEPEDFLANPKKYELFKVARINVPVDFEAKPFLPGEFVSIEFIKVVQDRVNGMPCPLYAVETCRNDETHATMLFANALGSFGL
jgi:hypothetical protein